MIEYRQPFKGDYAISLDYHEKWLPTYDNITKFHEGIDYLCPEGTEILASADGVVIASGFSATGYGEYIIIQHADETGTVYAHLSRRNKILFARVQQGEVIGWSGNTGNSSGPHLHFEWRRKASNYKSTEDPKTHLKTFFDIDPTNNTPVPVKPKFDTIQRGDCVVVADVVNVRCHCDMNRIMGQKHKGDIISVGYQVTEYMGLPFRDYYDSDFRCWLRIAEHDPDTQLIRNTEPEITPDDLPF